MTLIVFFAYTEYCICLLLPSFFFIILKDFISQLSEDEIRIIIKNLNNCVYWIIGHLTGARLSMLKLLDIHYEMPISIESFKKGSPGTYNPEWPAFSELFNHFNKMGDMIFNWLEKNNSELLNKKMKYVLNDDIVTTGDNLKFLIFHEDYHIGQIGLILKYLGKKGIGV